MAGFAGDFNGSRGSSLPPSFDAGPSLDRLRLGSFFISSPGTPAGLDGGNGALKSGFLGLSMVKFSDGRLSILSWVSGSGGVDLELPVLVSEP